MPEFKAFKNIIAAIEADFKSNFVEYATSYKVADYGAELECGDFSIYFLMEPEPALWPNPGQSSGIEYQKNDGYFYWNMMLYYTTTLLIINQPLQITIIIF